jgi:hypothetical protein
MRLADLVLPIAAFVVPTSAVATLVSNRPPSQCLIRLQRQASEKTAIRVTGFLFRSEGPRGHELVLIPKVCGKGGAIYMSLSPKNNEHRALARLIGSAVNQKRRSAMMPVGFDGVIHGKIRYSQPANEFNFAGNVLVSRVLDARQNEVAYYALGAR